ncbi:hypothetical protein [uncultured Oscillibacter sp.]|uniref:hypothetical protein n=1 Tax=uncultured Oscillibacter sp. TaxID=876091 RepID=UPI002623D7AC|nr:hypothetical protein [uncultured Oscillibacter sp.]
MKKLANLKPGAYFFYGGVQWVVLENNDKIGATLSIAAEPVFNRAFDEENRNDWRVSSLRRELNGPFLDALIAEGANRAAFCGFSLCPLRFGRRTQHGGPFGTMSALCTVGQKARRKWPRIH